MSKLSQPISQAGLLFAIISIEGTSICFFSRNFNCISFQSSTSDFISFQ